MGCLVNSPNGINYKDYNTWNVGLGLTWKVFTLDLRYSDTDLNKGDCNAFTSDPTATGVSNVTAINSGPGSKLVRRDFHRQAVGRPHARQPEVS